jgi:hypothetical protein
MAMVSVSLFQNHFAVEMVSVSCTPKPFCNENGFRGLQNHFAVEMVSVSCTPKPLDVLNGFKFSFSSIHSKKPSPEKTEETNPSQTQSPFLKITLPNHILLIKTNLTLQQFQNLNILHSQPP